MLPVFVASFRKLFTNLNSEPVILIIFYVKQQQSLRKKPLLNNWTIKRSIVFLLNKIPLSTKTRRKYVMGG
jgi:hypothetical protein